MAELLPQSQAGHQVIRGNKFILECEKALLPDNWLVKSLNYNFFCNGAYYISNNDYLNKLIINYYETDENNVEKILLESKNNYSSFDVDIKFIKEVYKTNITLGQLMPELTIETIKHLKFHNCKIYSIASNLNYSSADAVIITTELIYNKLTII